MILWHARRELERSRNHRFYNRPVDKSVQAMYTWWEYMDEIDLVNGENDTMRITVMEEETHPPPGDLLHEKPKVIRAIHQRLTPKISLEYQINTAYVAQSTISPLEEIRADGWMALGHYKIHRYCIRGRIRPGGDGYEPYRIVILAGEVSPPGIWYPWSGQPEDVPNEVLDGTYHGMFMADK
ncbi:hypothetical protein GUMBALL_85 [Mycobacterium phage Gumball]|uniref:Uncharacterized protein n=2 Tax=Plotvirus plot TaxID=2170099 RepID=B5U3W3_9CAUD|nr:DNA binding protein [Mycobacterium phage Gumball]ACI06459.1 hypothetical protein GUMBALL_85 [Mycobacterium phage Gumball]AEK10295.1 hypothetical protein PBI_SIRHARLEY_87 [Mycobacterium phage SirHarley]